jgi:GTPase SAR1 family protein
MSLPPKGRPNEGYLYLVKTMLMGMPSVGKATLQRTISEGIFSETDPGGLYSEFVHRIVHTAADAVPMKLQIWTARSHSRYNLSVAYFRGVQVILLCFAINDRSTFAYLMEYFLQQCYVNQRYLENTQFYLIGLKADLKKDRAVSKEEAKVRRKLLSILFSS